MRKLTANERWARPTSLTRTMRARLEQMAELAKHHNKMSGPAALMGINVHTFRRTVYHLTGSSSWPAVFEPWLFDLPVIAADDEGETIDTIRTKLRHWLTSTDTAIDALTRCSKISRARIDVYLEGGPIADALAGILLVKMRNAPWGYVGSTRRPMPISDEHGIGGHRPFTSDDELRARIDADQARLREPRLQQLQAEQERYALPRRGLMIEEMPA